MTGDGPLSSTWILHKRVRCFLYFRSQLGYSEDKRVVGAHEYDKAKEKAGFVAGKHIQGKARWWFQGSKKDWVESDGNNNGDATS